MDAITAPNGKYVGMTTTLLKITEVSKQYPDYRLGPISTEIAAGETIALMGKNGAGKTTLFQLLTGNLDATSGEIEFLGQRMRPEKFELKRRIGYLPQHLQLPRWSTGFELLHYAARLHNIAPSSHRVAAMAELFDCESYLHRPMATCSHGMQKRVGLAVATIHDPDLLILDEPFSGLDLFHIRALQDTIVQRTKSGKANIVSTHIAPYAATLCQRILMLEHGQLKEPAAWVRADSASRVALIENYFFPGDGQPA